MAWINLVREKKRQRAGRAGKGRVSLSAPGAGHLLRVRQIQDTPNSQRVAIIIWSSLPGPSLVTHLFLKLSFIRDRHAQDRGKANEAELLGQVRSKAGASERGVEVCGFSGWTFVRRSERRRYNAGRIASFRPLNWMPLSFFKTSFACCSATSTYVCCGCR